MTWVTQRIQAGELAKPGPEFDDFTRKLLVALWMETVMEIGPDKFDAAFRQVLKSSSFRPDISDIRKAAGINRGIVDPVEQAALQSLRTIIEKFRIHERKLKCVQPYPQFDERTEQALVDVGAGDRNAGIALLSTHPSLPWSECEPAYKLKTTQELERRWVSAYAGVR